MQNKIQTNSKDILRLMYLPTSTCLPTYLPTYLPILDFLAYPLIFILNVSKIINVATCQKTICPHV
jgi:hypothetical protein